MTTQSSYGRTKFPTGTNLDLFVIADDASDFILRAEDHRHALMQVGRLDVHDALISAGRNTARLFDDEGHRIGFVQQTQLAAFSRILCVLGVQEHATARQDAMHFGHHRCHPAHIEIDAARAGFPRYAFRCAQNREYRPNGDVHVDVGRTVQRIKYQQIFALRILCRNRIHIIHFFGSHRRQVTTPLGGFDKHLVGDDVQLLLRLALNVLATRPAQPTDQLAFVDIMCDLLAGYDDVADQASEIATDTRDRALFFDDELDQTLAHAVFPPSYRKFISNRETRAPFILGSSPENGTQPRSPVM